MNISIIGMVIGVMVLGAGIYYLVKEWKDYESKKIYTTVSVLGVVVFVVSLLTYIL